MDIRCPSCSTLYEFDAARVGPKGINVRCSACGQVFRVSSAAPDPTEQWMIRRESTGEVVQFADLSTLQRWIIEQKVSRRDKISKTGDAWRSLGSIQELAAFFKVVDELNDPKSSRDTDGHLTAENRATQTSGGGPAAPARARGFTPTPASAPASIGSLGGAPLMASAADVTAERPVSASHLTLAFAPQHIAAQPIPPRDSVAPPRQSAPEPRTASDSTDSDATRRLAAAAGLGAAAAAASARDSQAIHPAAHAVREQEITADPLPAAAVRPVESASARYSLGDSASWPATEDRHTPADVRRELDFTSEHTIVHRRERSQWPVILGVLLLFLAGALILVASLRPSLLGLGGADPVPLAGTEGPRPGLVATPPPTAGPAAGSSAGSGQGAGRGAPDGSEPGTAADGSVVEAGADVLAGSGDASGAVAPAAGGTLGGDLQPGGPGASADAARAAVGGSPPTAGAPAAQASADGAPAQPARDAAAPRPAPAAAPAAGPRDPAAAGAAPDAATSGGAAAALPATGRPVEIARPARPETRPATPSATRSYDDLMVQGNAALDAGRHQEALNAFTGATDARPSSAEAHVGVARAYEAMGRHDLAAVRYERATSVNSRYTPAWLGLGESRRRSGDIQGACTAFERVVAIVRTGRAAERAQQAIEQLCQ